MYQKKIKTTTKGQEELQLEKNFKIFKERVNKSFDNAYRDYYESLKNYLIGLCKDETMALDLTQDAFMKSLKEIEKYNPEYKFKTWLFTVATNLMRNRFEKKNRHKKKVTNIETKIADGLNLIDTISYEAEDLDTEEREYMMMTDIILDAIESMDEKYQKILILRFLEEKSYEEIKTITGLKLSTVKSRIRLGRMMLIDETADKINNVELDTRLEYNDVI